MKSSYELGPTPTKSGEQINKAYQVDDNSEVFTIDPKDNPRTNGTALNEVKVSIRQSKPRASLSVAFGDIDDDNESMFDDEEFAEDGCCYKCVDKTHGTLFRCLIDNKRALIIAICLLLLLLFGAYFVYACIYNWRQAIGLIVLTALLVLVVAAVYICKFFGEGLERCWTPIDTWVEEKWKYLRWFVYLLLVAAFIVFIVLDVIRDVRRLTSLSGMVFLVFITFICSKHPARVRWRPVIWGLVLQLIFGLIVLRWKMGLMAVDWFARQVVTFLTYADEGSKFVFGETEYMHHPFAFQSLPVVIFFSAVISILYHWGVMQGVIRFLAHFMQYTMGTTALESLASASNIFVSYVEVAPMMVPYMSRLTRSEIHCILTSGFATVAGSILAIYIIFLGEDHAQHLISACLISAPAAMAIAKLSYPETKVSLTKHQEDVKLPKGKEHNFIEAAANGAMIAIPLVAGVAACLIAFIGIVTFLNAVLGWLGGMVGYPQLSFQEICSYIFWPLVIMMGVDVQDARRVATQMGLKVFLDDVLCYADLGEAIAQGVISDRSAVIATYACCGFGSLGAMGIALGAMLAVTRVRKSTIVSLVPRALINGNIAAFMTACVAGLLYDGPLYLQPILNGTTPANMTGMMT